ncbi:MAG: branched-chain amino acid ABC transporter permease [Desulfovibrio sp.]|jgi:branched-chain amino acid transport system permease protein|nr:branched-chain amino acid ABC transporter permease [Desulfovibrio sp.]
MTELVAQIVVSGIFIGLIFSLVSVGLNIIFGVMNIVNFAHGEFMMLAMYAAYWIFQFTNLSPLLSLPICTLAIFILGVLCYVCLISRIMSAPMLIQIFATFGLMLFLQNIAFFLWSSDYHILRDPFIGGKRIMLMDGVYLGLPQLIAGIGASLITAFLFWLINKTELGRALRATAENKDAASLMGINTERMFALAWGIGGACAAAAGALIATFYPIFPQVGTVFCQTAFVVVVLGGFGSITGAFIAGIIIGIVQVVGGFTFEPAYKHIFVFALFLLIMFIRPKGLLGR